MAKTVLFFCFAKIPPVAFASLWNMESLEVNAAVPYAMVKANFAAINRCKENVKLSP